ncbi:MAG: hypothetical protein Q4G58_10760 [bacterium]|nr:hypothetical protein [bacterium]
MKSDRFMSARGKGVLSIIDFPGAVCENIAALKDKKRTSNLIELLVLFKI